jgi:pre-mRNA-splicing factor 38B
MSGNARGPSTAFCLLFRLFTMEPDDGRVSLYFGTL